MALSTFGANVELVAALHRGGVRFMVIGGVATAHYAPERVSEDPGEIDLLIEPAADNASRLIGALASLGVGDAAITVERVARLNVQVQVKNGGFFYADIVTPRPDDDDFAALFARAVDERLGLTPVKVISKNDQLARLRRSDQAKHQRDVELLEKA